jgi:uncharacterized membrane protein YozB (DUF420 family)
VIDVTDLAAVNASLNATSALLLVGGYLCIRRRRVTAHRTCMVLALGVSSVFLTSYVIYHANVGSRPYTGQGWTRGVYFAVLISHVTLAAAVPPLALVTVSRAFSGRFPAHVRLARWTLPIWLYVSVTGVIVYLMLYS